QDVPADDGDVLVERRVFHVTGLPGTDQPNGHPEPSPRAASGLREPKSTASRGESERCEPRQLLLPVTRPLALNLAGRENVAQGRVGREVGDAGEDQHRGEGDAALGVWDLGGYGRREERARR